MSNSNSSSLRERILADIQSNLSEERFQHTLRVEETACRLANIHGYWQAEEISLAALLHDNAKYLSLPQLLSYCRAYPSSMQLSEQYQPVLHAFAGAVRARELYPGLSEELYTAIAYHTTGRPGMSLPEKIIFIADYIEPGRPSLPTFETARKLAEKNLDCALRYILAETIAYLQAKKQPLYPLTFESYQYYTMTV